MLRRTMPTQEIHEAGFPTASMPKRWWAAHTALGTGTRAVRNCRAGFAARSNWRS